MIRAKPHQQQPPNPATCEHCGETFNNARRLADHQSDERTACPAPLPWWEQMRSELCTEYSGDSDVG